MVIVLYQKKYKGMKVMFNSRKGSGMIIEGIAVQEVPELDVVILRDRENFSHAVSKNSITEI
jgi:hypothetical protein